MRCREIFRQLLCPPGKSFSFALRSGIGGGKPEAEWRNGLSEAAQPERRCQCQTEAGRDCGPFPSVRDERALQGCVTCVGRGLAPQAFAFRMADFFLVALGRRDWRPLRYRAKGSWNRHCAVRVTVWCWLWTVRPVPFEWLPVAPRLVYWDDVAFSAWLNPALRGNNGRWSGARLRGRRFRAIWRGWFDTRLCVSAVQ